MKKLLNILNNVENYILMITFPLMLLFVFLATVFRYLQLGSLTWAEEASRYLMIWLAFAGISLGFKKNAHLGLSFVVDKLPNKSKKTVNIISSLLIILFGVLVAYNTSLLINVQIMNPQISPGLGIPVWWVYSSILFGSFMIIIRCLQIIYKQIINQEE